MDMRILRPATLTAAVALAVSGIATVPARQTP